MTDTSIRISTKNRQGLKRMMPDYGETYDDVIEALLEEQQGD